MQLQPSTQSWRVICVRDGMRAQLGERELERPLDQPVDLELPVGEAVRRHARGSRASSASVEPLALKCVEMSASLNSRASAVGDEQRALASRGSESRRSRGRAANHGWSESSLAAAEQRRAADGRPARQEAAAAEARSRAHGCSSAFRST